MSYQLALPFGDSQTLGELLLGLPSNGPWDASTLETEDMDFKETPETTGAPRHALDQHRARFSKDLVETAVAFANTRGGTIVVGVRDKAKEGSDVIPGVDVARGGAEDLRDLISRRTNPPLLADVA